MFFARCCGGRELRCYARAAAGKVLRWVVCELLRVCVNSGWHGCARERSL
tara:strand:+ start:251 stop:400 length:150 start_codon:yes stop_codon:yes gene_type:complete